MAPSYRRDLAFLAGYGVLYFATLAAMVRLEHFQAEEPLLLLILVGGGFTFLAWIVTRGIRPAAIETSSTAPVVAYLLVIAAFVTWGLDLMPASQPLGDLTKAAAKLLVFVAIPAMLFRTRLEWTWSADHTRAAVVMIIIVTLFQAAFGSGFRRTAEAMSPGRALLIAPLALIALCIEAGLVEEYFFRAVLQTRLERALRSSVGAICATSLLFGLVHAPGLYLRTANTNEALGANPSLLMAVGYSIVVLSPTGFFLGLLWSRTRSLPLVVAIHGAADLVPNLTDFARHFHAI